MSFSTRPVRQIVGISCTLIMLSGCTSDPFGSVSAANLDPTKVDTAEKDTDFNTAKADLQKIVVDSQIKCNSFMAGIVAKETNTNTYLDIGTTIASAAATATSAPLSAVHALTATSAVLSGTKTAIDSDYFAKATAGNYAQALQGTYFAQIATYSGDLGNATLPANESVSAWVAGEVPKIQNIHFSCGLGPAQSSISAKLATQQPATAAAQATVTLTVSAASGTTAATGPGTLKIQATASFVIPVIPVNINTGDKPATIASNTVTAITNTMSTAGITTILAKAGTSTGTVIISSNAADNVKWASPTISGSTGITASIAGTSSGAPAAGAAAPGPILPPGQPAPGATTTGNVQTPFFIPGRSW